jgi:hypothetical protein
MNSNELKTAIRDLGVADRMRVCVHGNTLHVYLSKAVRTNPALLSKICLLIETTTGRKDICVPGRHTRYSIVPTFEARPGEVLCD